VSVWRRERRAVTFQTLWGSDRHAGLHRSGYSGLDAFAVDAVIGAVGLRAGHLAQVPFRAYRMVDGTPQPLERQPALLRTPSATVVPSVWRVQMSTSRDLWGYAAGLIVSTDAVGWPTQVEWLPPWQMVPTQTTVGGRLDWRLSGQPIDASRVLHVPSRWVMPGNPAGVAPLERAGLVELSRKAQDFGRDWFTNGAVPSMMIYSDQVLTEDQSEEISSRIVQKWRNRKPAVAGSGLKVEALDIKGDDTMMLATLRQLRTSIAVAYNLPPEKLGGEVSGGALTYGNRESNQAALLVDSLNPDLVIIAETLTANLPQPQWVEAVTGALLQSDLKTRYEAHQIGVQAGFLTPNEARSLENLAPLPGGDLLRPVVSSSAPQARSLGGDA
jgi:HK97 family phage portal protein